jgi:hypothetical protein
MTDVRMRRKVAKLEKRLSECEEKILAVGGAFESALKLTAEPTEDYITRHLPDYSNLRQRI